MRVAVTGGSGVVGSAVVSRLVSSGHQVRALARSPESSAKLASIGAEPVAGDVLDRESLSALVAGADWVFHVAGVNEMCPARPDRMWEANVAGTANIVDACAAGSVSRLIHTSSAVTIGQRSGETGSETTLHRGWFLSEYERSKVEAEIVALRGVEGLEVVAVNPSSVQGPGRATGTGRILLAAARGRLSIGVDTTLSLVDIDDCARGHVLAAERGIPGERYLLSGATLTVAEAAAVLSRVLGREVSTRLVSPRVLTPVAAAIEWVARLARRSPPLCREMVRVLAHGHIYDGSKATDALGLEYTPVEETFRRAVDWFRHEGLLRAGR